MDAYSIACLYINQVYGIILVHNENGLRTVINGVFTKRADPEKPDHKQSRESLTI